MSGKNNVNNKNTGNNKNNANDKKVNLKENELSDDMLEQVAGGALSQDGWADVLSNGKIPASASNLCQK